MLSSNNSDVFYGNNTSPKNEEKIMSQKILVAGATGQIGTYVVKMSQERGADFVAGVSRPERAIEGVECVVFNYTDHVRIFLQELVQ